MTDKPLNFLAVGPHCWGRATTRAEAVRLAAQNFPRNQYPKVKRPQDKHFSIFTSSGKLWVDELGGVHSEVDDIAKVQKSILAT